MYHERYDPLLHPDDGSSHSSPTRNRVVLLSVIVSGSLLLYAVATAMA
jgi:hypothetical protein